LKQICHMGIPHK